MSRRLCAALLAAAALAGCAPVAMDAGHEGGVARFRTGSGEEARHDQAIAGIRDHCRSQGFTTYSIVREYEEDGLRGIDFSCRN